MSYSVAQQASDAAQRFSDLGEETVKAIERKIREHATTTVPVTAITVALVVLLRKNPRSFNHFANHFLEDAGYAFPCAATAKELWNWVNS